MAHKYIINKDDLQWTRTQGPPGFDSERKQLGAMAHGRLLGCSLLRLAPGSRPFPLHAHLANEEAIYILSGSGIMRLGESREKVRAGDYIAMPPDIHLAHQLINDGDVPLEYLCISTMIEPEVVHYPDSNKVGVLAGAAPGGPKELRTITSFFPADAAVDYWEGETSETGSK